MVKIEGSQPEAYFYANELKVGTTAITEAYNGFQAGRAILRMERVANYLPDVVVFLDNGSFVQSEKVRVRHLYPTERVVITK